MLSYFKMIVLENLSSLRWEMEQNADFTSTAGWIEASPQKIPGNNSSHTKAEI